MHTITAHFRDGTVRIDLPGESTTIIDGHSYPLVVPIRRDLRSDLLRARWDLARAREDGRLEVAPIPPMNSPTFRAVREHLGLPASWCAARFDVQERTIRKWDQGDALVPAGVAADLWAITEQTREFVDAQAHALRGEFPAIFEIPRNARDLAEMTPVNDFPLDWWRNVGARLVQALPGLVLEWIDFEDDGVRVAGAGAGRAAMGWS